MISDNSAGNVAFFYTFFSCTYADFTIDFLRSDSSDDDFIMLSI